jgi:AcrR family transcriptional regulator
MLTDQSEARQTRRYVEKREVILDTAAALFNRKGARHDPGRRRATGGAQHQQHHVLLPKKEDLVLACLMRAIAETCGLVDKAAQADSPSERARAFITLFVARLARTAVGEKPELMSLREIRALPESHVEVAFAAFNDMFRRVRGLLCDALPSDPPSAARCARAPAVVADQRSCRLDRSI